MNRQEMITMLCQSLRLMNGERVANGQVTQEELDRFVESERSRYEAMDDLQLHSICVINFL